jgi:hypothetical protein
MLNVNLRQRALRYATRKITNSNPENEKEACWKQDSEQEMLTSNNSEECHIGSLYEVLFGLDATQMNVRHCESIYSWAIHQLVNSYDRLKSKFNSFAAKCLTERQKRECGSLTLIAPPLVLPCEEKA